MTTRGLRWLSISAALAVALSGCTGPGDTSLYVKNDSDQTVYVKVTQWVVRVEPGADGLAVSWTGRVAPVHVLSLDCSPIGTFRQTDDGTYVVDEIPGLTARIENHGSLFVSSGGFTGSSDCGGVQYS
jgi:hypothetical protein